MSFFKWSKTANSNAIADSTINWAEGQAPSTVNDSARAMMAAAAKYRDDVAGAVATSGTSTAYTLSSNQVFDSLANLDGKIVAFVPHVTSGAGPVTLNVDGLGAKALRPSPGVELLPGTLIAGTPYVALYRNAGNEWLLHGFFGANPYNVPLGTGLPFFGRVAPNSSFAFPRGQAISRTAYAGLFALIGTTYGAGDGATTFLLPDLSGRLLACREGMDGAPAPGRITTAGSGIDGSALGATGGSEIVTLATPQIPSHTHANTLNDPGHSHGVSDPAHTHTLNDPTHAHAVNDPSHTHGSSSLGLSGGGLSGFSSGALAPGAVLVNAAATGISIQAAATGISVQTATSGVSVQSASSGASIVNAAQGGGLAHNNMPPTMMVNFIMRVL
jgi:microcystin-dependent protein